MQSEYGCQFLDLVTWFGILEASEHKAMWLSFFQRPLLKQLIGVTNIHQINKRPPPSPHLLIPSPSVHRSRTVWRRAASRPTPRSRERPASVRSGTRAPCATTGGRRLRTGQRWPTTGRRPRAARSRHPTGQSGSGEDGCRERAAAGALTLVEERCGASGGGGMTAVGWRNDGGGMEERRRWNEGKAA